MERILLGLRVVRVPLSPLTVGQFDKRDHYGDGGIVLKSEPTEIVVVYPQDPKTQKAEDPKNRETQNLQGS